MVQPAPRFAGGDAQKRVPADPAAPSSTAALRDRAATCAVARQAACCAKAVLVSLDQGSVRRSGQVGRQPRQGPGSDRPTIDSTAARAGTGTPDAPQRRRPSRQRYAPDCRPACRRRRRSPDAESGITASSNGSAGTSSACPAQRVPVFAPYARARARSGAACAPVTGCVNVRLRACRCSLRLISPPSARPSRRPGFPARSRHICRRR